MADDPTRWKAAIFMLARVCNGCVMEMKLIASRPQETTGDLRGG